MNELPTEQDAIEFISRNFGSMSSYERGLLLAEEVGEVCRAVLKRGQGIRGSYDDWTAEIRKEAADVYIGLLAMAGSEGFSLQRAVAERWQDVSTRDYRRNSISHDIPTDEAVK